MIRPLAYCLTSAHFESSIQTIDQRILELLDLREEYVFQAKDVQQVKEHMERSTFFQELTTRIKQNELESTDEQK